MAFDANVRLLSPWVKELNGERQVGAVSTLENRWIEWKRKATGNPLREQMQRCPYFTSSSKWGEAVWVIGYEITNLWLKICTCTLIAPDPGSIQAPGGYMTLPIAATTEVWRKHCHCRRHRHAAIQNSRWNSFSSQI